MADQPDNKQSITPILIVGSILIGIYLLSTVMMTDWRKTPQPRYTISYTELKQLVNENNVAEVTLSDHHAKGELKTPLQIGPEGEVASSFSTQIPVFGADKLLALLEERGVLINVEAIDDSPGWTSILLGLLPWLIFIGFFFWISQRAYKNIGGGPLGGAGGLNEFVKPVANKGEVPDVTFDNVAGQVNAKNEVQELVDFLRQYDRYTRLGAEVPHGVLLMGPPGTGKTLLAKALAGEAGVPFYSISGSEFIEVFVGVGASRVRSLFNEAKKNAPSIIFIDELDSIGRTRGTGLGGGHDEREQTLNQILAEMDGFSGHEAVVVLAATNRPDVLDPALLRPGRFDRHVTLDLPDKDDRVAILKVHVRKVPLASDVDLENISASTPGFSGADLKNLVNEAAMLATRENCDEVTMAHFDAMRDKILMGTVRTMAIQPEEKHRLAVHEAGHTLIAFCLPNADPLYKVSIIPRGQALGVTQQMPSEERHVMPEDYLLDRIGVMMGGYCAEKELLGSVSSGADDDIHQATALARSMVSRWGMSEEIGPVDFRDSENHPFLGREIAQPRHFSENSAMEIDHAVQKLLKTAVNRVTDIIQSNRSSLDALVMALEHNETLYQGQIEECLRDCVPGGKPPLQGVN